jgi:hypothetical protein
VLSQAATASTFQEACRASIGGAANIKHGKSRDLRKQNVLYLWTQNGRKKDLQTDLKNGCKTDLKSGCQTDL